MQQELYKSILCQRLGELALEALQPQQQNLAALARQGSMQMLADIQALLANRALDNEQCLREIVRLFERMGAYGGDRFGC